VLHGVYGLLEELGVGFHLGGDTFPEGRSAARLPLPFSRTQKPAFATRGVLLHDNLIAGTTTWGLADYQFFFNQISHMRCNTFMLAHYGDTAAEVWDETDGRMVNHWPVMSSLTKKWGALRALRTSQFSFGTGDLFDEEIFSCPAAQTLADPIAQRHEAVRVFSEATRYANAVGIKVAGGFWAPIGDVNDPADPTDAKTVARFKERVRRYLARNPHLSYFLLINHEAGGCCGTALPREAGPARELFEAQRERFAYLGNPRRVWEAIRFGRFAQITHDFLREVAPHLPLVLCGWGGDRWMLFADYFLGYDSLLPPDIIFSCYDNIDASYTKNVSTPLGKLSPARQRWAVPWVEEDGADCLTPQPNVDALRRLAPDALRKGCQGLLTMHWRTRDCEEEAGYAARFGWDTALTPETFFAWLGRAAFGPEHGPVMGQHLLDLQRLRRRWTGVMGSTAVGDAVFAGTKPHPPFELDARVIDHLLPMARAAVQRLSEPFAEKNQGQYEGAMFALAHGLAAADTVAVDPAKLGVKEYLAAERRLEALRGENRPEVLRRELTEIMESLFAVRTRLIERWMSPAQFCGTDIFIIRLHFLVSYAGVKARWATLERIRADLAHRRGQLGPGQRERLDFLAATMDFVMNFDRAAMLLADGEEVDRVIQDRDTARAAEAYTKMVDAGMRDAVLAQTRKLTTRCEFGVLSIVNTKQLGVYWNTVAALEKLLPVAPPREIFVNLHGGEAHVWWEPAPVRIDINDPWTLQCTGKTAGYHVYRRDLTSGEVVRLTVEPLPADGAMFLDRPAAKTCYRYTVTALDAAGTEGPHSHPAEIDLREEDGPRLVASQPPSVAYAGQPFEVRVVATGARAVAQVALFHRAAGAKRWQELPMRNRFRRSWHAAIPGDRVRPGILEWFVLATDESGRTATWPATIRQNRPWTASIQEQA
jgi:hypothetical protein